MIKKKTLKSAFHGLIESSFSQKKKVVLENIKHTDNKKNVFLVKSGFSDSIYSNVNSLSGDDGNVDMAGISSKFLLDLAVTTSKKTVVEFAELEQAKQLASKWSFLIGKDSVCVAMAMRDQDIWMFKDCFKALLFTLLMETTVHDLGTLLEKAGMKTCVINHSLVTGNQFCCAVVGFNSNENLESVFYTEPIFGGVKLSWTRMDLVYCKKCSCFKHFALECDSLDVLIPFSPKFYKKVVLEKIHL
ncbi:hypothetical protein G9A89_011222 [Geosiphon pyriformis]|nr:hypothetical protein G9A89_011222 [Geosiphon pyriformis]